MASTTTPSRPAKQESGGSAIVSIYLIAYNVSQMLGWLAILVIMVSTIVQDKCTKNIYKAVEPILQICQTAAVLEILHCMIGLVRSNWVLTAFQVYSRVFVVWAIVWSVPAVQVGINMPLLLFPWTISEIIRYSFYFFNLLPGAVPYFLVWCRYTFFIVLYPIGITGELMSIYGALATVKKTQLYSFAMPNPYNVSFDFYYFLYFTMFMYIPVFPQLYLHMFSQRKKVIGGASKPSRAKSD